MIKKFLYAIRSAYYWDKARNEHDNDRDCRRDGSAGIALIDRIVKDMVNRDSI